jgi:uncharacterized protein (TIGR03067 family)
VEVVPTSRLITPPLTAHFFLGLTGVIQRRIISSKTQNTLMKHLFLTIGVSMLFIQQAAFADDLEALSGKWSVKKVNDQGQNITQTIEVKKDKFVFEILSSDDTVVLHGEGDFKLEKIGPFNAARFSHIRAGSSASNLDDVDDEFVSIYSLDGDNWTMASNFDKQRDGQKPGVDVYHHVKAEAKAK